MALPATLEIQPFRHAPAAIIAVPGSKSITNRALVLAALTAKGYAFALRGALQSEDTEVMIDCLRALGFRVLTEWPQAVVFVSSEETDPIIPARSADLHVANSGTTMRFLTAMVSLGNGRYRLDGVPRMRQRPIEDLLAALRQLGVDAQSENHDGCPPVVVQTQGLAGGLVRIQGNISSQFLSGLLMAAAQAQGKVDIHVTGPRVSEPYIHMTVHMLRQFGYFVLDINPEHFTVFGRGGQQPDVDSLVKAAAFHEGFDPRRHTLLRDYQIEPDASAASYFWGAAAVLGGQVTVPYLDRKSLQGDVRFLDVLQDMGCSIREEKAGLTLQGGPLHGIDVDMNDISDTVMTLAAVACFAQGQTTIRNVAHIRHKETDRLAALATELGKIGAGIEEFADGLTINPGPLHGAAIDTYHDHRMAMSLALVGLRVPGIVIRNPGCVGKTYPQFFDDLEKLRG